MEFRFSERNKEVTVKCSKILLKEVILNKGNLNDFVFLFTWDSLDSRDGLKKSNTFEIVPDTLPHELALNDPQHIVLHEKWPNGWLHFRKNFDGVRVSFRKQNTDIGVSGPDFVLVFEIQ